MKHFLSCDWGTTAFRLRLVETDGIKVIEEQSTRQGIGDTYQRWKQSSESGKERLPFYLDIISGHIKAIGERTGTSLDDLPLIISGMASSTIGMVDLPYKALPARVDGSNFIVHTIKPADEFKNTAFIISGLRTEDDVMRGEETKLAGCYPANNSNAISTYIFPGTHPKHVEVKNGEAIAFKTYMTGEFFELLSKKSILSASVAEGGSLQSGNNVQNFEKGVRDSIHSNLLHQCFLIRTNDVFKKLNRQQNYHYLSGLMIGSELKELLSDSRDITVVGGSALSAQYVTALQVLELPKQGAILRTEDADEALMKGQIKVLKRLTVNS
ncbi:MAG TPA: 2-dehydro-3-deoxygalactonokinase [Segetibacter sp.]